jgi:hypothetical protein
VVTGASWQSAYDVRVNTKTADGKPKCQLQYYGVITNNCGEQWTNVSMALSTAKPSLGGQPPALPTCVIKFKDELRKSRSERVFIYSLTMRCFLTVYETIGRNFEIS